MRIECRIWSPTGVTAHGLQEYETEQDSKRQGPAASTARSATAVAVAVSGIVRTAGERPIECTRTVKCSSVSKPAASKGTGRFPEDWVLSPSELREAKDAVGGVAPKALYA